MSILDASRVEKAPVGLEEGLDCAVPEEAHVTGYKPDQQYLPEGPEEAGGYHDAPCQCGVLQVSNVELARVAVELGGGEYGQAAAAHGEDGEEQVEALDIGGAAVAVKQWPEDPQEGSADEREQVAGVRVPIPLHRLLCARLLMVGHEEGCGQSEHGTEEVHGRAPTEVNEQILLEDHTRVQLVEDQLEEGEQYCLFE